MSENKNVLNSVRESASARILYLPHAVRQMSRPERMISTAEVRQAIETGELVEDYPDDPRGHSCLILGRGADDRPIHVVCSPRSEYLAIITAYLPNQAEWQNNFRKRKNS